MNQRYLPNKEILDQTEIAPKATPPPYFDILLKKFKEGEGAAIEAFQHNVHFGYWAQPKTGSITPKEYGEAGERMLEEVLREAHIENGQRVLDVGCGFGGTIDKINEEYRACDLIGVNIDERQLAVARANIQPKNDNEVKFVQADACKLPFENGTFDRILCVEAIFHFPSRKEFFQEAARVLKPGGALVLTDFVPIRLLGPLAQAFERTTGLVGKAYGSLDVNISASKYKHLAEQNGLGLNAVKDVTRNTLPTYRFMKQHFHLIDEGELFRRATSLIEYASRIGVLRYLIFSFTKTEEARVIATTKDI